jgi:hypothetical protein
VRGEESEFATEVLMSQKDVNVAHVNTGEEDIICTYLSFCGVLT